MPAANTFSNIKGKRNKPKSYHSLLELQFSIFEYMEGYYHLKRPHGSLNTLTPNEAETLY